MKEIALSIFAISQHQTLWLQICAKKFGEQQIASWVFKWSKAVRFAKGLVFKWHLNTGLNSPVFEWLGCVITIIMLWYSHSYVLPFENLTLKSSVFR